MRLKRSLPGIEHRSIKPTEGLEHLRSDWVAIVRWLNANKVEYVLIGPVAEAIRGNAKVQGPVAIVPAPYRRNLERLSRALSNEHARQRVDAGKAAGADPVPVKMTAEKLAESTRWTLRCGANDLDVEGGIRAAGDAPGIPSYQELLYEAGRFELEPGVGVEVASPEDIHHFAHLRRTGVRPEIRITRQSRAPEEPPSQDSPPAQDQDGRTEDRENEHDSA
jgi:hypothetical protein